jgi:hypothetical protein
MAEYGGHVATSRDITQITPGDHREATSQCKAMFAWSVAAAAHTRFVGPYLVGGKVYQQCCDVILLPQLLQRLYKP